MKSSLNIMIIAVLFIVAAIIGLLSMDKKKYVASINGEKISEGELHDELVANYGTDVLQSLVNQKMIEMEIEKENINVPREDIDEEVEKYKEEYGGEAAFKKALEASGMNAADFESNIKDYLALTKLMEKRITITEKEMKSYFKENKDQFEQKEQVTASHILVKDEAAARNVIKKLGEGEDFAALAEKHSTDEMTSEFGGDLGTFGRGEMVKEFEEAVFSMKVGEVSDPVKTEYGYHIIKLNGKTKAKKADYESAKEEIRSTLFESKMNDEVPAWLEEIKEVYDVEYLLDH
ncbi:peptidylprolyl isomerase [Siminovitchia acidinfaciens]|nr:peptidylprolyl isomerase [Siminovitchia acidinfaciens]